MKKIIILDDDAINTQILKWMLRDTKFDIITLQSHVGLEPLMDQVRPELIIMDIMLDGINGNDICRSLKQSVDYSSIPIFLTSANSEYFKRDSLADGFLSKPYTIDGIFNKINEFI